MYIANTPNCGEVLVKYKTTVPRIDFFKVKSSTDATKYFRSKMFCEDMINFREEMGMIMLNRSNKVIGWCRLSIGGISGTSCDPKIVFFHALHLGASAIILAHNHPSGNLKPSNADLDLTRKITEGAKFFEIKILDHLILTDTSFCSFADEGLM